MDVSGGTFGVASMFHASVALGWREVVRFLRQRSRLVGAIAQPVIFWILFGAGLHSSFQPPGWSSELHEPLTYQEYFFPGIAVLIVLFTAIFSTITIIEDRRDGFLQGVLAAPVSRLAIVAGKLLGGVFLALVQAALFMVIGPLLSSVGVVPQIDLQISILQWIPALCFLALVAVELTAIGFVMAWPMNSTQGYHALMSVFLMPMWLLSGAFFPGGERGWLSWLIWANPLTYGVAGFRRLLYSEALPVTSELPALSVCVAVTFVTSGLCIGASVWMVSRPAQHNVV
ncbi:MAG: ABC transporter permease [Planctomyces sp.]|nr:ABC transporter permease [Planctomyces sp.]